MRILATPTGLSTLLLAQVTLAQSNVAQGAAQTVHVVQVQNLDFVQS
jgi:hypothetical protein